MLRHRRLAATAAVCASAALGACNWVDVPQNQFDSLNIPEGWLVSRGVGYLVGVTNETHSGAIAAYIRGRNQAPNTIGSLSQRLSAEPYRGKRVRWSAWIKSIDVLNTATDTLTGLAGLLIRVDGESSTLALDDMAKRPLLGSADWHLVEAIVDVPQNALGITVGIVLRATGEIKIDDARLEVVGPEAAVTARAGGALPQDSLDVADYPRQSTVLFNGGFEGMPAPMTPTTTWLREHSAVLTTTDPGAAFGDLAPLGGAIGTARIVALGEATHGTREFFLMKHRFLRYMVANLGFTDFAIEASDADAEEVNHYVLTGEGNAQRALLHLGFWSSYTQEMLDLVEWMREWNSTAPVDKRVRFRGFDMTLPGAALDSVAAFIEKTDPSHIAFVAERYACLDLFRNFGLNGAAKLPAVYAAQPANVRQECASGLQEVRDYLAAGAARASSGYARALHDARLVQQFEQYIAAPAGPAGYLRDAFMAENVEWILDQAGPRGRLAISAHNGHVARKSRFMGAAIAAVHGADYVNIAFDFGTGRFNSRVVETSQIAATEAPVYPYFAMESYFQATARDLVLFDARQIASGGAAAAALAGPLQMRSIGPTFSTSSPLQYIEHPYQDLFVFPADFDLVLYISTTTASTLLNPFGA